MKYVSILQSYQKKIEDECAVQVLLEPSNVQPCGFHVRLSLLPHPVIVGNGRVRIRLAVTTQADVVSSFQGIEDCLENSIKLAHWFDREQGGIRAGSGWAMAHHRKVDSDEEMINDLENTENYRYAERWLCEIEFNLQE